MTRLTPEPVSPITRPASVKLFNSATRKNVSTAEKIHFFLLLPACAVLDAVRHAPNDSLLVLAVINPSNSPGVFGVRLNNHVPY